MLLILLRYYSCWLEILGYSSSLHFFCHDIWDFYVCGSRKLAEICCFTYWVNTSIISSREHPDWGCCLSLLFFKWLVIKYKQFSSSWTATLMSHFSLFMLINVKKFGLSRNSKVILVILSKSFSSSPCNIFWIGMKRSLRCSLEYIKWKVDCHSHRRVLWFNCKTSSLFLPVGARHVDAECCGFWLVGFSVKMWVTSGGGAGAIDPRERVLWLTCWVKVLRVQYIMLRPRSVQCNITMENRWHAMQCMCELSIYKTHKDK